MEQRSLAYQRLDIRRSHLPRPFTSAYIGDATDLANLRFLLGPPFKDSEAGISFCMDTLYLLGMGKASERAVKAYIDTVIGSFGMAVAVRPQELAKAGEIGTDDIAAAVAEGYMAEMAIRRKSLFGIMGKEPYVCLGKGFSPKSDHLTRKVDSPCEYFRAPLFTRR